MKFVSGMKSKIGGMFANAKNKIGGNKNTFKSILAIIGVVALICGVLFGVYMGIGWAFIGGIVQFVEAVKATPVEGLQVALGVARVFFCAVIGWVSGLIACIPGFLLIKASD